MKKIFKILSISFIAAATFVACDKNETAYDALDFPSQAFIKFNSNSASVLESVGNDIEVTLNLSTDLASHTTPITVNFDITNENGTAGVNYEIVDNKTSFEFQPGVFSDKVIIKPLDNLEEDGDKILTFSLTSVSPANYTLGFPGPDGNGTEFKLTLQDDDCSYTFEDLANATWSGQDNVSASQAGPNESLVSFSTDGTNLFATGLGYAWLTDTGYWNEVVVVEEPVLLQVDALGNITIDEQFMCTTTWLGDVQPDYSIRGTGLYTSCSQTMTITFDLLQNGGVTKTITETVSF